MKTLKLYAILALLLIIGACASDSNDEIEYDLLESTQAALFSDCSEGGVNYISGLDTNGNGILDDDEITDTRTQCNPVDGVVFNVPSDIPFEDIPIANVRPAYNTKCGTDGGNAPGIGGKLLTLGFDSDNSGELDYEWDHLLIPNGELLVWQNICLEIRSGVVLTYVDYIYPNEECVNGGYRVKVGTDLNETRFLEEDEVQFETTFCIE
jgi:hypothetical protein